MTEAYMQVIENLVVGDDYDWDLSVSDVPAGQTLVSGWLTVKRYATDTSYIFQKLVTPSLSNAGQITISGAYTNILITASYSDTRLLNPMGEYEYDVQVLTSAGKYKTIEKGIIKPIQDVT